MLSNIDNSGAGSSKWSQPNFENYSQNESDSPKAKSQSFSENFIEQRIRLEKNRTIDKNIKLKFDNPKTVKLIEKLHIQDLDQLLSFKNTELILNFIDEETSLVLLFINIPLSIFIF